jgi:hypothetical protein
MDRKEEPESLEKKLANKEDLISIVQRFLLTGETFKFLSQLSKFHNTFSRHNLKEAYIEELLKYLQASDGTNLTKKFIFRCFSAIKGVHFKPQALIALQWFLKSLKSFGHKFSSRSDAHEVRQKLSSLSIILFKTNPISSYTKLGYLY